MRHDTDDRLEDYTWRDFASEAWKPVAAVVLAAALGLTLLADARGDQPIPDGVWSCESGVCANPYGLERKGNKVYVDALIYDRGVSSRATLVRDCTAGVTTAIGLPNVAEDWPLRDIRLSWLCGHRTGGEQ